ncbi:MAG: histidinol-phosphatase [bacterium]|nr:histidinol-phosphatase [bacterium]
MIDYHVHSEFSVDSQTSLIEFCDEALRKGILEMGFSEHIDLDPKDPGCNFYNDLQYGRDLNILKSLFGSSIILKKGVEITYQPQYLDKIEQILSEISVDFVIGSIHFVNDWNVSSSNEEDVSKFKTIKPQEAYTQYFLRLLELVKTGLFDVIGHFDIIARYGHIYYGDYNPGDYSETISQIIRTIIESGKVIEINTSGLRNSPKHTYPHFEIIKKYAELGGDTVVFGSDAHYVKFLGYEFSKAYDLARSAGIKYQAIFKNREIIDRRKF